MTEQEKKEYTTHVVLTTLFAVLTVFCLIIIGAFMYIYVTRPFI